jgi:DNA repair exonuclease SbcCD ATPase subunit
MPDRPREQLLDLPEGDPLSTEHIDEKVQLAEAQEQQLKRQLEQIERQKRELEELSRRQEQLNVGKSEFIDKLTRALVVVEREAFEATKRVELLEAIRVSFSQHLSMLESINPKTWEGLDINRELTKALAAVDDARAEYSKSFPKVSAAAANASDHRHLEDDGESGHHYETGAPANDFVAWLKIGLAFSIPLIVFGLIVLIVIVSRLPGK